MRCDFVPNLLVKETAVSNVCRNSTILANLSPLQSNTVFPQFLPPPFISTPFNAMIFNLQKFKFHYILHLNYLLSYPPSSLSANIFTSPKIDR